MNCFEKWKPVIAMIGIDFALAVANVLLKKAVDGGVNHLVIVTYRQAISMLFLAPIAYFWERKGVSSLTGCLTCHLFFSALLGMTLSQYFFLVGLNYTTPTFTCAFINLVPVNTFIMAVMFGVEKVNPKSKSGRAKVTGALIACGGALVLSLYKGTPLINPQPSNQASANKHISTKSWAVGSIFLFVGSVVWASWFLIQARIGKRYPFQYSSTAIMSFFSAIQSAVLSFIIERNVSSAWVIRGMIEISSIVYAGIVGSGLCYVGMSWCVKQRGPVFTAALSPFIQIFVAVFDISILRSEIDLGSILGSILVVIGMYVLLWGKSHEAEVAETCRHGDASTEKNADPGDPELQASRPVTSCSQRS